jgi:excisionase family DNA binding protein
MEVWCMVNLQSYLRIKQAAEFLGVSESTLRNWGRNGKITTHRHPISRYRLYKKADLEGLLKEIEKSANPNSIGRPKKEIG